VLKPYPAPARENATIPVVIAAPAGGRSQFAVKADIFDVAGRKVASVYDGIMPAGRYAFDWDGRTDSGASAPAGIYLARVTVEGRVIGTAKIARLK